MDPARRPRRIAVKPRTGGSGGGRSGRESRRFELIFEASGLPKLIVDEAGVIAYANSAANSLLGAPGTPLVGTSIDALVPQRLRHAHPDLRQGFWNAPSQRGMNGTRAVTATALTGEELIVEVTLSPVPFDERAAVLVTVMDVSERQLQTDQLRRRTDELVRSNDALERFAWAASHDLQEPLRMITSYTELLASRYADVLDDAGRTMVGFTIDGARRMQALVNDLLSYARANRGGKEPEITDPGAQLEAALVLLALGITSTGATIERPDAMPAVMIEPGELRQVWQNLVDNSLRHASDVPPMITISAAPVPGSGSSREPELIRFAVRDNGIGIDPKYHALVFEPFRRVDRRRDGTGLGLALCRTVIESHGGSIGVDSRLGDGAEFWFTLPRPKSST